MTSITGNASEFITFSRTSNATVTDSDGKIKWAPHNLLLASEQFDAASWLKTNAGSTTPTVTANAAVAPNGTTTAETVALGAIDAAGDSSVVYQTFTAVDATYRGGVYVKAATGGDVGKKVWMFMYDSAYRGVASVTLTTEWQLLSSTATLTAGANREFYIATIGSTNGGENQGAVSVHLWGAHLYRSDLGGMQANTSAYPMYNPTTPKNLLGFTEDFSNWAKTVSGDTITINAATAPNGLQTADLWVADGTSANHRLDQTVSVQPTTGTYSFYVKLQTASAFVQISQSGNNAGWVNFDLVNGTKSDQGTGMTGSITSVGNGWYRCSAYNTNSPSANLRLSLVTGLTAARIETAAISSGIYLWGAQLSDSASLDSYVPVYGAAVTSAAYYGPRRDFDPVTLACKGLLVEEQRANLLLQSAAFDNAAWTNATPNTPTVTANNLVAPDGTTTGDTLTAATGGIASQARQSINATGALAYTFSVYIKQGTSTQSRILVRDETNGTNFIQAGAITWSSGAPVIGSTTGTWATPVSVGNGWWRLAGTGTAGAGASVNLLIGVYPDNLAGTGTLGVYGAQLEAGSFATSYIPVGATTAGATRSADVASVSTQAFPYSATEGTWVANWSALAATSNARIIGTSLVSDAAPLAISTSTAVASWSGTTNLVSTSGSSTLGPVKAALGYSASGRSLVHAGTTATTDSAVMPTQTQFYMSRGYDTSAYLNGHIRQITYLPRRISNTELQTRTA